MGNILSSNWFNSFWSYYYGGIVLERVESNIIGKGSFGVVYRGTLLGKDVAVKAINRHYNHRYWEKLQNEVITLQKSLKHDNVIQILSFEDKFPPMPEIWIAMELCDESLQKYLDNQDLSVSQMLDILWQGAQGLAYLHDNHLVHRDIKPDNFLVKLEDSKITMKVTDFSLSKDIEGFFDSESTSVHGNKNWLAPEMFDSKGSKASTIKFTAATIKKIDVFSFGLIILYTCLSPEGREEMCGIYEIGSRVKRGEDVLGYFGKFWGSIVRRHIQVRILSDMLSLNPEERPSMMEVSEFLSRQLNKPIVEVPPCSVKLIASTTIESFPWCTDIRIGRENHIFLYTQSSIQSVIKFSNGEYNQLWTRSRVDKEHKVDDALMEMLTPVDQLKLTRNTHSWIVHGKDSGNVVHVELKVPLEHWESDKNTSVCRRPSTGQIAVFDGKEDSLSQFNKEGECLSRTNLNLISDFSTTKRETISSDKYLIVLQYTEQKVQEWTDDRSCQEMDIYFYVYTWEGVEVCYATLSELVERSPEYDNHVFRVSVDGDIVHVAKGSSGSELDEVMGDEIVYMGEGYDSRYSYLVKQSYITTLYALNCCSFPPHT